MLDDEGVIKMLMAWCWIDMATYSFVLGFSIHNAAKFLVFQGRWRKLYLTGFYVLTVFLTIVRIFFFFFWSRLLLVEEPEDSKKS